jgi:epsilon-lactone hydrolase
VPSPEHDGVAQLMGAQSASLRSQARDVSELRASFEQMAGLFPAPADVKVEALEVEGRPAEWIGAPGAREDRVVLYLHGGGYVVGSPATHRELASRISRASGGRILSLDYRLAPEFPAPAAVEDAVAAYRWLLALGVPAQRLAIAGDSAGGGLSLSTLMALRDAGDPLPACAILLSPWVDLEGLGASAQPGAVDDPVIDVEALREWGTSYGAKVGIRDPRAAPLHGSFASLPPLLIQVGTREVLLADSVRAIEKARAAGVDVTAEIEDGLIHVWQFFGPSVPEAARSVESIGSFLQKHWR